MRDAHWNRTQERRDAARQMGLERRTHGASQPGDELYPTYRSWQAMKRRCDNPKDTYFGRYGGRGIGYDPRWASFESFLSDVGQRPAGMTLDRIDNDGAYAPGNVRWATASEQRRNHPQSRGWKSRPRKPVVYGCHDLPCIGCGTTLTVKSVVSRAMCPDCRKAARPSYVAAWVAKDRAPCSADGCDRKSLSKGLCSLHYQRARKSA